MVDFVMAWNVPEQLNTNDDSNSGVNAPDLSHVQLWDLRFQTMAYASGFEHAIPHP